MALAAGALAAPAAAQVDVELAFDPTMAGPGDVVTLFASVANLGAEATVADLEVTVTAYGFTIGPLPGKIRLAAGQELSREIALTIPRLPSSGDVSITVTASAGGFSDTATATLSIVVPQGNAGDDSLAGLGEVVLHALALEPTAAEALSLGAVKARYR